MTDAGADSMPADPQQQLRAALRVTLANFLRGDYARGFFSRILSQALAVIILIEAIFLAEHFTWVFRDAVRHEADLSGIALVLACTSTEIFDLALAVALLMAAYLTLLRMRESRELLVLFASGLGPYQLGVLILVVALAGQVVGIIGSGLADPLSRYAQRSILFSSELRSLKKGVAKNEFYFFPSYVAYAMDHVVDGAPPPRAPNDGPDNASDRVPVIDASGEAAKAARAGKDRTLFVYQQVGPQASRVVTAAQARLDGPDRTGKIVLNLNDFTSHTFADAHPMASETSQAHPDAAKCPNCTIVQEGMDGLPPVSMKVRDMSQLMMVDQLLPFTARSANTAEQTIFEQLLVPDMQSTESRAAQMKLLAERFSRSLLSFLAPLIALLGVAFTNRLTNWFALPLSCILLMAANLLCEWVITRVAPLNLAGALIPPLLLYGAAAYAIFTLIVWRHNDFVRPQLERA
ncbi:MAG TPA: LptF/LptG family permease [Rhizomicrobium sp.]|nr:LptF/LptG family permease [Rhizomicrobium sp.]